MIYSKPSYRDITSLSFNYADVPPLFSKTSTINSFNSLQSSKLSRNSNFSTFTQKLFTESVVKYNNSLFPLGTTSTQNSYFSPLAHKSSDASALVKNASSFSSNLDNSLVSKASLAICKTNSNPQSNLVFKDHSKSHVLPVSVKLAIPGQCLFLIFVFLPRFPILVMLWFKNLVLVLTYLSLVLPQIHLYNVFFVTKNSQALRFLLLLNLPS